MRLLRKRLIKYDVSFDIGVLRATIPRSGNEYFLKKIRSSYLQNKNSFLLIFSPICSKLVSPLKKLFQFKKFGISHGLLFEFPHLVFLIQLVQLFFLSTGFDLIGAKSFYSCLIHGKISWLEVACPIIRDGWHFDFGFYKNFFDCVRQWNFE